MGACQSLRADLDIELKATLVHARDIGGRLVVIELAHVEVDAPLLTGGAGCPTEERVAGGLHESLTEDDALTLMLEDIADGVALEDRVGRFLHLQPEGVIVAIADE